MIIIKNDKKRKMWNHKGYILAIQGKFEEALKCFNKALKIYENDKIALLNKGNALSILKRPSEALNCIEKILLDNPKDLDALTLQSIVLRDLGNPEKGLEVVNEVLEYRPNDFYAMANKVMLLNELGKYQEVVELSDKILLNSPDHLETLINKAAALNKLKKFNKSLEIYDFVLEKKPNYVDALVDKAILLSDMGESADAIALYDKALAIEPKNPIILGNKGNELDLIGDTDNALLCYEQALNIDLENDFVLLNKAALLNNNEKFSESLELLNKLKSLHPKYPHTYTHLGIVHLNLSDFENALENFTIAKNLFPITFKEALESIDNKIKITEKLINLNNDLKPLDEKFLELIQSEKWLELRNYNRLFYQQFELILGKYDLKDLPIRFVELLNAKKDLLKLVDNIFNKVMIPDSIFNENGEVFRKYELKDYILVINNLENLDINIKTYGSLEAFLRRKKELLIMQLHDLAKIDGFLTEIAFSKLNFPISKKKRLLTASSIDKQSLKKEPREVNILHISDLHFGIENTKEISEAELIKRKTTLSKFIKNIKSFSKKNFNWKPDLIVITGDIGFAGKRQDYKLANKWLENLLSALEIPHEHLIICPGNHDRNIKGLERDYPQDIEDSDEYWYNFKNEKNEIRFNEFITFSKEFLKPLYLDNQKQDLAGFRDIMDIRFLVLNSARYAIGGDDDRGKLFLGWPDVNLMDKENLLINSNKFDSSIITILIFHHPRECLHNQVINEFKSHAATYNFLAERCHIILTGHTHAEKIGQPLISGEGALHFSIGSMYLRQNYINNCEILKIDMHSRSVTRLIINFDPSELEWRAEESRIISFYL